MKMSCPQDPDGSNCSDFKIVASPSNSEESSSAAEDAAHESTAEVEKAKLKPTTPYSKLCAYCQMISDNLMTIKRKHDVEYVTTRLDVDEDWYSKATSFDHYLLEAHLKDSAVGCILCRLFAEGDEECHIPEKHMPLRAAIVTYAPWRQRTGQWKIKLKRAWKDDMGVFVHVKAIDNAGMTPHLT